MWQPVLEADRRKLGTAYARGEGDEGLEVIALLDPPRHALPEGAYPRARENAIELLRQLPADQPFVIGLPFDFHSESAAPPAPGEPAVSAFLPALADTPQAEIVCLEEAWVHAEYKGLEARAIEAMERVGPLARVISSAHRDALNELPRQALPQFLDRVRRYRIDRAMSAAEYLESLVTTARELGVEPDPADGHILNRYQRLREFESINPNASVVVGNLRGELAAAIDAAARMPAVRRRAAWEVLRAAFIRSSDAESARLAEIDGWLAQDDPPPPSRDAEAALDEAVREACTEDAIRARPGLDKRERLGDHGEQISHLLELAAILGVSPMAVPNVPLMSLPHWVHYAENERQLRLATRGLVARRIDEATGRLEEEVARRLCESEAEAHLFDLAPVTAFFEALGRFQLVHDEHLRPVILRIDLHEVGNRLGRLGATLPGGWREQAASAAPALDVVRDYYDATILRGKDLARALVTAAGAARVRRAAAVVDGYLNQSLSRWLEGRRLAYALVTPSW